MQFFEPSDDYRGRRRLQPPLTVASGSASRRRPRIRGRRRPLSIVHHSIADVHHRSKLAVDHLDILAGFRLAGEPPLFFFISCPRICIARPKLDPITETVSTNRTAPRRPGQSAPGQSSQTLFQIRIQISDLIQIL
jgi:hypothetical protein